MKTIGYSIGDTVKIYYKINGKTILKIFKAREPSCIYVSDSVEKIIVNGDKKYKKHWI